jgi:hypothetical protein
MLLLLESPPELPQPLIVGSIHWSHVDVGIGAGRRHLQVHGHQLLVRKQGRFRTTGDREEAAAIPLIFSPLLLIKAAKPLLTSIFL